MSEGVERLQVDVDATTVAYLRRRCVHRGDLASAAANALRELAVHDAAASLARYHQTHEAETLASFDDGDTALAGMR